MPSRFLACLRGIALLSAVILMAALSSGVLNSSAVPIRAVLGAPSAVRYPPEEFPGTVVAGSITTTAGATQFVVDRPKKTGNTFDATQREQVTSRLENVPADQSALVVDNATLFFDGTYDPDLRIFFVSYVGTRPMPVVAPPAAPPADNNFDGVDDNSVEDNGVEDNDVEDNDVEDNDVEDNDVEDNDVEDNDVEDNDVEDNDVEDNDVEDNDTGDN